jgi:hypothetical protein
MSSLTFSGPSQLHSPQTKSLAIPAPGRKPNFDDVAGIALTAALCNLSVCVLCLTQGMLGCWMRRLGDFSVPITLLDVLNTNRATLADWEVFLSGGSYDVIVLHGARVELQADRLSVGYVKALVDAVPSGLVMVA